jgi:hypothetical protein
VIIGAKRPEQLADNLAAVDIHLSEEELAQLDAVSALPREYPGWMLERQGEYRRDQLARSKHRRCLAGSAPPIRLFYLLRSQKTILCFAWVGIVYMTSHEI